MISLFILKIFILIFFYTKLIEILHQGEVAMKTNLVS